MILNKLLVSKLGDTQFSLEEYKPSSRTKHCVCCSEPAFPMSVTKYCFK